MKKYALKKAFFLHQHQKGRNFVIVYIYSYIYYEIELFFSVHMKKFLCSEEAPMIQDSIEIELKIKIDWSGSAVPHWSERRKFISFEHISQPEPTKKLRVKIKFGFHFETVLPMYGTQKMIFENLY